MAHNAYGGQQRYRGDPYGGRVQRRAEIKLNIDDFPPLSTVVAKQAQNFVQRRPITTALWAVGLLLAATATGCTADEVARMRYEAALDKADHIIEGELRRAREAVRKAEADYYGVKGWFSCNEACQRAWKTVEREQANKNRVEGKVNAMIHSGKVEVGVWSTFAVQDVRKSFWDSWESGKEFAQRMTMWDAMFMAFSPRDRDEGLIGVVIQLVLRYLTNLTLGLGAAFVYFIVTVYGLIQSYGPSLLSSVMFFFLVLISALGVLAAYMVGIWGVAGGAGYLMIRKVAEQQAMQDGRPRRQHIE